VGFELTTLVVIGTSPGTPVSSTNKTDSHGITEILLKAALNTINSSPNPYKISVVIFLNN
jgi:hypothetical protein